MWSEAFLFSEVSCIVSTFVRKPLGPGCGQSLEMTIFRQDLFE